MRILSLVVVIIGFVFLVAAITGYLIDPKYESEQEVILDYSQQSVWNVLNDFENMAQGKKDVESVDLLGRYLNLYAWVENLDNGGFRRYRQVLKEENSRMIIEMTDSSNGLVGTWEFNFSRVDSETLIKVKQSSINNSIISRGFRFYFGRDKEAKEWIKFFRVRLYNSLLTTP